MLSIFKWQKINFQTSQFNHFAFCCKSMTSSSHDVVKVFFFTHPTNPIWVWVQRIPSFFLYYCKQKFYNHFCKAWGFMLQNQGNMPWCRPCFLEFFLKILTNYRGSTVPKRKSWKTKKGKNVIIYHIWGPPKNLNHF